MTQAAGLKKIAEGREAEVFAWDDATVLKLYREGYDVRSRDVEASAMAAARAVGGPAPEMRGALERAGRHGLLIERVDGADMLTRIGRQPGRIFRAGGVIARVHAALHETPAPPELPSLRDRLLRGLGSPLVPAHARAAALAALEKLPDGDRVCHGDFHPGNIIETSHGAVVIDWPGASRGDPAGDVARTQLMMRLGSLPPGTPFLIRALQSFGRWYLAGAYARSYRRARPDAYARAAAWMLPVAVHRLAENITEERTKLLAFIQELSSAAG